MSGVFGFIDTGGRAPSVAGEMARRLAHHDWYQREVWIAPDGVAGLGRIGAGILNREPQPATTAGGGIVLFLAGEFFDWESAPAADHPKRGAREPDADYALRLYERYGPGFVCHLAGAFAVAVYDATRRIVLVANDRYGLYPLYAHRRQGVLAFAPEVKGVLAAPLTPRQLDDVALAQYLRFQQVLGTRTFFSEVEAMPFASRLIFDLASGASRIEPYWSFDEIQIRQNGITFADATQEAVRLMRQAVARRVRGDYRIGVYLSGGLDSRTILAAYPPDRPRPATLTYGLRDCRDVYYAAKLATRAGTPHTAVEFAGGKWVKDWAGEHLALTEGFHSWVHMHGISTLDAARSRFDIDLTGFAGDQHLGGFSTESVKLIEQPDEAAYLVRLFQLFNQSYNWPSLTEAEEHVALTPAVRARIAGLAFESLRQELQPYLKHDPARRLDYFAFTQLDLRHYGHHVTFTRSRIDVRHPFCDYDLVDFLLGLPPEFRYTRRLEVVVLNALSPSLARVPIDKDESLPTERRAIRSAHALVLKAKRRFNRHVYPLFRERSTLHSDYENWLRGDLREWAESILFDRRTLERGIFNPDFIRSIWARHQSGREEWTLGKIAPIMSYEMMLRALHDEPARPG